MSIGIIGGADGPTAIFLSSSSGLGTFAATAVTICIAAVAVIVIRRLKNGKR